MLLSSVLLQIAGSVLWTSIRHSTVQTSSRTRQQFRPTTMIARQAGVACVNRAWQSTRLIEVGSAGVVEDRWTEPRRTPVRSVVRPGTHAAETTETRTAGVVASCDDGVFVRA